MAGGEDGARRLCKVRVAALLPFFVMDHRRKAVL